MNPCHFCNMTPEVGYPLPLYLVGLLEQHVCSKCFESQPSPLPRVFKVPSHNLPILKEKFDKLGRRAKKCNLPPPTYTVYREEPVKVAKKNPETQEKEERIYLLHYLTVDPGCAEVKVAGWTFVATIQHTEEGNIIRAVEGKSIPPKYRQVTQLCEHCDTKRNRKDTYILHHEDSNEYKQVGRNCLEDFFGHDALMYAERAQYVCDISDLASACEDEEGFGGGWGSRGESFDDLERYLGYVAECIRHDGWMSRTRARSMGQEYLATASVAMKHLHPPKGRQEYERWLRNRKFTEVSEESRQVAKDAIAWAESLEGEEISDYLHNIRVVARRGLVGYKETGLAASIVSAYQRHMNTLRMQERAARRADISQHVGQIGDRRIFKLLVEKVLQFERDGYSYYSPSITTHMHMMSDEDGNQFVWWSSSGALETGKEVVLKGTVKKHDQYVSKKNPDIKPIKQTVLSRCEEVELKNYIVFVDGEKYEFEATSEKEVRPMLREKLGVGKLPRGIQILEAQPEAFVLPLENINDLSVSL